MKRALALLSAAVLTCSLTACGDAGSAVSSVSEQAVVSSAPPELTEADVLAAYDRAAEVYDWFDLYSLPASGALVTENGLPYDSSRGGIPYQAVDYAGLNCYADLDIRVRSCFSPELADDIMKAVQRACELVELLGAGEVVDGVMDVIAKDAAPTTLKLEPERINALLGTDVCEPEMRAILEKLDFRLDGDVITVPSWRGDVEGMYLK